ncbi:choline-sulfatase [Mesorhizobium sp. B4-1-4]|uniref:choline-sulfatase n=1 Tax=Mesorhizobium sp. B4-1-4 TaxID=2589888 RepID=UPI001126F838|nr:choline-sulfatase [Mesorhizobium sp. B4-1-4]UCI34638.1 choline-sulfatase [Mesorhizobium sp. B4-1-4]
MSHKQPNILLVMCDQLTAIALSVYGNAVCKTPNIDRLAAEGSVFENAYCNYPLCAPSRFALMSGRLPSRIGAYDNAAEFPAAVPTIAHYLRDAGYYTCISGKMHFVGPDQHHGYEDRLTTEIYPADFSWVPPKIYDELQDEEATGKSKVPFGVSSVETIADAAPLARSQQIDYDDEVARRATQHIFDWRRYGDGRPLFMTVSFTQPHDPYVITREYWDLYSDECIDPPRTPTIALEDMDPHSRSLHFHYSLDKFEVTDEIYRRARRGYYGMISYVDQKLGELRRTLADSGIANDTVIIFTSDHGDMIGERGLWFKKNLFDPAIRVPLIVYQPGAAALARITAPVSLIDIMPTLVEIATGSTDAIVTEHEGDSLLSLLGKDQPDRIVMAEHIDGGTKAPRVMLRQGTSKIVVSEAYPTQFFDLGLDAGETRNLAEDPAWRDNVAALMERVQQTWDLSRLRDDVMQSQRIRQFVNRAMQKGKLREWEHYPDAIREHTKFVRTGERFPEVERRSYLPYGDY